MNRALTCAVTAPALVVLLAVGACGARHPHTPVFPPGPRGPVVGVSVTDGGTDRPCPRADVTDMCRNVYALKVRDWRGGVREVPVTWQVVQVCEYGETYPFCKEGS